MKQHRSRVKWQLSLGALGIVGSLLMIAVGAVAAFASGPVYVPNEYIVTAKPGTTLSAVDQAVAQIGGAVIKPLPLANAYLVEMGKPVAASKSLMKRSGPTQWPILGFYPNYIKSLAVSSVVPNDPLFATNQWTMGLINMPKAWSIEKGSASVTVAVIDSGVADHPDLLGRVLPGYDFIDDDADPSNDGLGHGTFCSGVIAAQGDNSIDVCGVCWDGVNILPLRIFDDNGGGATTDRILQALEYARVHGVDVISMSYGSPGIDIMEQAKIRELDSAGIVLVAAAGNSGNSLFPDVSAPAAYPEVIAVSAVGPNDQIAYYSSYGPGNEVDIAAPGGDSSLGPQAEVYSTSVMWTGDIPTFYIDHGQGTSYACPHVAGAAALLLSAGVPSSEVRNRLELSARKSRTGTMDVRKYGAGILDVAAALSEGSVTVSKPVKGSTVADYPDFKISVRGIDPNSLSVYLDYADGDQDGLPDDLHSEIPVLSGRGAIQYLNDTGTAYLFNWSDIANTPLSPGLHFVYVTATTTSADTVEDWGTFAVSSNLIPRGTYLVALPYAATLSLNDGLRHPLPQELLWDAGTSQTLDFRTNSPTRSKLVRWSTLDSQYLYYLPNENDIPATNDRSWMNLLSPFYNAPTGGGYLTSDPSTLQFPAGAGFWLILQQDAVIGNAFPVISADAGLSVPLYRGWNLIGNPFARQVALSTIKLKYHGQIRTLDDDQKSQQPWLQRPAPPKSQFYGYTSNGIPGYVAVSWRDMLQPYQGYWIRALVGGYLPTDRLEIVLQ